MVFDFEHVKGRVVVYGPDMKIKPQLPHRYGATLYVHLAAIFKLNLFLKKYVINKRNY